MEAIRSEKFAPKFKAYYFIARNHQLIENPKHAIQALTEGLRELELLRIAPKQKAEEKIKLLEMLYRLYSERGFQRNAEEVQKQLAQIRREGGGEESPPQQKPSRVEEAGPAAAPSAPPAGEANPAARDT
jgi:FKBP-type peptidyl-prolyl cis-trans isomerase (trigger factor)